VAPVSEIVRSRSRARGLYIRRTYITPNLLQIAPPSEPADAHSRPAELGHKLRQTPARPGSSTALRHFEDIEQQLRGNALNAIVANFTVHAFQRQPPGVGVSSGALGSRLSKLFQKRQHHLILRLRLPPPMLGKNC